MDIYSIELLCESEYKIIAIKRSSKSTPRVSIKREVFWVTSPLEDIPNDILKTADAIVHLASHSANHPYDTLYHCIDQNVVKHLTFIENAYQSRVRRFLLAGSCFEYGTSGFRYDFIPVDAPLEPKESYPVSKAMFFLAAKEFFNNNEALVTYQRIFQVFGDGEAKSRFWPSLREKALAGENMLMTAGEQIRDFIHVNDVAIILRRKVKDLLFSEESRFFMVENLASGVPKSLREFAQFWWEEWDAKGDIIFGAIPYRENEVMRFIPDLNQKECDN